MMFRGGGGEWKEDNPYYAVIEFSKGHPEFRLEQPAWVFNESSIVKNVTHWPYPGGKENERSE